MAEGMSFLRPYSFNKEIWGNKEEENFIDPDTPDYDIRGQASVGAKYYSDTPPGRRRLNIRNGEAVWRNNRSKQGRKTR
jgi:hypothetical protein